MSVLSDGAEPMTWMGPVAAGVVLGWLLMHRQPIAWRVMPLMVPCYGVLCEMLGPPGSSAAHLFGAAAGAIVALSSRATYV